MVALFANSYVDRIFADRDLGAIHQLISVINKQRLWPDHAAALDTWLDEHSQQIHDAIFALISVRKDCLKHES